MNLQTGLLVSSDSWSDFVIYASISHYHFVIFCWSLSFQRVCQPWQSVHHSLPPVHKCSNVTDLYELPDFWLPNSPDQTHFITRSGAASLPEKAQDVNGLRRHLMDVWVGVEQIVIDDGIDQWRRRLHAYIRFREEDILNIHRDMAKTLLTVIN